MLGSLIPRKLPQQDRAKATRDAILEAATRVISAGGLAAFTTNSVAARAGVSIGSLYQYFPNKDALMVALIHQQQKRQLDAVSATMERLDGLDLATAVRAIVRAAIRHHHENSLYASAIDHEEERLPIRSAIGDYLEQSRAVVRVLLDRFANEIGSIDPDRAAQSLPTLVRAISDQWANLPTPLLDVAEDEAVRAVLGYLLARPLSKKTPRVRCIRRLSL